MVQPELAVFVYDRTEIKGNDVRSRRSTSSAAFLKRIVFRRGTSSAALLESDVF